MAHQVMVWKFCNLSSCCSWVHLLGRKIISKWMLVQEASFYNSNLFFKTLQGFCIDFLWFERWEENNHSREYWGTWLWLCIILFIAVIIFGTCPPCPKKEIDEAFSEYSVPAFGESIISNILQDDVKLLKRPCSRHSASCLPKCLKLPSRLHCTAGRKTGLRQTTG